MARKRRNKRRQGYGLRRSKYSTPNATLHDDRHDPVVHTPAPASHPHTVPATPTPSLTPYLHQIASATGAAVATGATGGTRQEAEQAATHEFYHPTPAPGILDVPDIGHDLESTVKYGHLGSLHERVSRQLHEQDKRDQSHAYKRIEVAKAIKENIKTTNSGKPVTQKVEVPVDKAKMQEALADFKQRIAHITENETNPAQAQDKIYAARQDAHKALTREVTMPVFKPGHEEAFQDRIQQIQDAAQAIRTGDLHVNDLAPEQRKEVHRATEAHAALKAMDPTHRYLAEAGINPISVGGEALKSLSEVSNRTGVSKVFDYLTRPGAFVESGVAKLLSGEHFGPFQGPDWIKGKTAERIHAAPGPGEAFTKGYSDPKVISGGDITQGLFNARWAGLGADILLDPVTYIGGGGLISNLPKLKNVAKAEALIAKKAPDVLADERYIRYAAIARRSGDYTELDNYLKRVVEARSLKGYVSPRDIAKRLALHRGQVAELAASARNRLVNAETIKGKPVRLFGEHGSQAIAEAARSAELHRALRPGFRIRFLTPGGNEFAHIPIPFKGPLAKIPIPVFDPTMARRLAQLEGKGSRSVRLTTLDKFTQQLSHTRTVREVTRLSNDMARTMDQEQQEALKRALKPITKTGRTNERSYNRVGLYMHLRDAYQSPEAAARALGGLSKKEHRAVDNLDKLYRAQVQQGKELGTIQASVPFYTPRLWNDEARHFSDTVDPVRRMEDRFAPSFTTAMNASKHRQFSDIAEAADPELLTKAIKELHYGNITAERAAEIADDVYDLARHRGQTELLARQIQRGHAPHMDELGPTWQQTVINGARDPETAVFKHPDETDGIVTLANTADKYHGFDDSLSGLPAEEAANAKLYSAQKDITRAEAMRANYSPHDTTPLYTVEGEPPTTVADIHNDLSRHMDRLNDEINGLYDEGASDIGHIPEHEGRVSEDSLDYTGRLKNVRKDQHFPVLDPAVNAFYRSRTEAVTAALTQRWQGLDQALGRSIDEVDDLRKGKAGTIYYDDKNGVAYQDPLAAGKNDALGQAITDAIGPGRLWPTWALDDVRAEAMRLGEGTYKQFFYTGMEHAFGRAMSLMRYGVTTPFPAFQIRNMISDIFKSLQAGGTGLMFHPLMTGKLVALAARREKAGLIPFTNIPGLRLRIAPDRMEIKVPGLADRMPVQDFLYMLDLFGVRNGQHLAEYLKLAAQGKRSTALKSRLARGTQIGPEGAVGKRLIEGGARREDVMRFLTFTQRMRKNGGDVANAAWYMTKHHFDYSDLTAFEKRVMRNLFLFYTWYRKNIPLQFSEIITRPGFFAGVTNAYYDLPRGETPLNQDWSKINPLFPDMSGKIPMKGTIPDYMMNPLGAFQTNWNGHAAAFAFAAPWTDMNLAENMLNSANVEDAIKQFSSMLNPAVGLLISMGYRTDPLTGRTYKTFEPTAGVLASVFKAMGIEVQTNPETGAQEIPWQLAALVRQLPILGRSAGYALPPTGVYDDKSWIATHRGLFGALSGMTPFIGPREDQLSKFQENQALERVGQRRELSESLTNVSNKVSKQKLAEYDKATLRWAKDHDIPFSILQGIEGSGFYKSQSAKPTLGGASGSSGTLGGASGTGNTLGGASSSSPFGASSSEKDKTPPGLKAAEKRAQQREQKTLGKVPGYVPTAYKQDVADAAKANGVRPEILAAQLNQESGFNKLAVSPAGAAGIAQFMPGTADSVGLNNPLDPHASIAAQGKLMGQLLQQFNGNEAAALAAYNAGPAHDWINSDTTAESIPADFSGGQTKNYVTGILSAAGQGSSTGAPKPVSRKRFLRGVKISPGLPTAADLGVKDDNVVLDNIHPDLKRALIKLGKQTGIKPIINEGFRTESYQAHLAATVSGPVAAPGQSMHESGLAVDVDNNAQYTEEQLNKAGLGHMVANDPEHFQLLDEPTALVGPLAGQPPTNVPSGAPSWAPSATGGSLPSPTIPAPTTPGERLISAQRGLTPRQVVKKLRPSDYFKSTKQGLMPADYMLAAPENPASASYGLAYSDVPPEEGRYDLPIQAEVDALIARLRTL